MLKETSLYLPLAHSELSELSELSDGMGAFSRRHQTCQPKLEGWPSHFEGSSLHPTEATRFQNLIAKDFTGDTATFRSAGREVVLRRATRGTRRLHATETCLRANNYQITGHRIDSEGWLTYFSAREGEIYHIREQITDGIRNWSSPSSWFWQATLRPKSGPWLAATVITPVR